MSHYDALARCFDLFNGQATDDLPVYIGLAQRAGSPVLELGCGTGRVALALAREGFNVTGVDNSPEMLATAQRKIDQAGLGKRAALLQADLRDLNIERRFKLAVCAQNTFCHMLTAADQVRLLRAAWRHLDPGGLLALDVFNPDPAVLAGNDQRLVLMGVETDPAVGRTFTQIMSRELDLGEQLEHVTLFVDEMDGAQLVGRHIARLELRYVFRFELELLLDKAGFELEMLYGSYDLEPFTGESERLLAVARRR